jgi:hypothetical protein
MTSYHFLSGAVTLGFMVCALFFLRFWQRTGDPLFVAFGLAFGLLGGSQLMLAFANLPTEERAPIYLIRLAAFVLIILAIARKNRAST